MTFQGDAFLNYFHVPFWEYVSSVYVYSGKTQIFLDFNVSTAVGLKYSVHIVVHTSS
jgi:hypothetical protein